ncbi:hypothetical protein ACWCQS_36830 [Streptomyces sp. NPDC002076]
MGKRVVLMSRASGIGEATARLLRKQGPHVVASGRRVAPQRRLERETGPLARPSDAGDPEAVASVRLTPGEDPRPTDQLGPPSEEISHGGEKPLPFPPRPAVDDCPAAFLAQSSCERADLPPCWR